MATMDRIVKRFHIVLPSDLGSLHHLQLLPHHLLPPLPQHSLQLGKVVRVPLPIAPVLFFQTLPLLIFDAQSEFDVILLPGDDFSLILSLIVVVIVEGLHSLLSADLGNMYVVIV